MSIVLALLSALSSATNLLSQRVSSRVAPRGSIRRVGAYLVRDRLWLFGLAAAIAAFVLQAAALRHGALSQVQPLLVSELVFVLLLRRLWLRQPVRNAAWASAGLICVGLGAFLLAAEPRGGHPVPDEDVWAAAIGVFAGASVVMVVAASRGSPVRRAALYASAAAITGALSATFTKTAVTTLTVSGPVAVLTDWPVYALVASAITSGLLVQAALHTGPLSVSQPLMVVLNPIMSIGLSVWLFGEYFTEDAAVLTVAGCSFAALSLGVVLMSRTAPQHDERAGAAGPGGVVRPGRGI